MNTSSVSLLTAHLPEHYATARLLFQAYADSLGFDLCFQNFSQEMATLEQQYAAPQGALLLLFRGQEAIGCCGVRRWDQGIAELKRMYLRPEARGQGAGRQLLDAACQTARHLGYTHLRLDTLPAMEAAVALYLRHDFYPIPAYRDNPVPGTLYLEKHLS